MRFTIFLLESRTLAAALLGLALAAPAARAQRADLPEPAASLPAQEERARAEADLARSVRRILHLSTGGAVTGVARCVDGRWELKLAGGAWQSFPAGAVTRAPKEADVQRELKQRAEALLESGDLDEHVALLEWMADEGLYTDALRAADELLERSPHHAGTLSFLRRRPLLAVPSLEVDAQELPAAREALYRWAANAPSAARELAIHALAELEAQEAVRSDLLAGLGDFSVRRRAFCAHAIGRLFPGQEAKRLLQHAVLDPSSDARRQAAQALGAADQPGLIVPVVRALASTKLRVRVQAAEALGYMGYPAAVEPLVDYIGAAQAGSSNRVPHGYIFVGKQTAYIQDFDVEVATFQAVADPQINVLLEGEVLEGGVSGVLEYRYAAEAGVARSSLGRLTGADPGNTGRAWQSWWSENQARWKDAGLQPTAGADN
jgi:hypothetical protein